MKLSNDIKCLLVSDYSLDQTAVISLNVEGGSLLDPKELPEFAHLCQKTLTARSNILTPQEHYSWLIDLHKGGQSSQTKPNNIQFSLKFDPEPNQKTMELERIIQIFASFFKDPVFDEDVIKRHIQAIDQKYDQGFLDEEMRLLQFESSILTKKASVLNKQLYGNKEILKQPDIAQKLADFFKKNYSANLMSLTLIGNQPLDELQKLVAKNFSDIKNTEVKLDKYENIENQYQGLGSIYRIPPIKETTEEMVIKFPWLPDQRSNWRSRPLHYLIHAMTESLMGELVKLKLATFVECSHEDILRQSKTNFEIRIKLTDTGVKRYKQVISTVFAKINGLKKHKPPRYIHDELQQIDQAEFKDYRIGYDVLKYSEYLAEAIQKRQEGALSELPIQDLLRKPYALETHRPDLIHELLGHMKPQNCYVLFLTRMHKNFVPPLEFQAEPFFGTEYNKEVFDNTFLQMLSLVESSGYPPKRIKKQKTQETEQPQKDPSLKKQDIFQLAPLKLIRGGSDEEMKNMQVRPSRVWFRQHDGISKREQKPTIWARVKVMTNDSDFDATPLYHMYLLLWEKLMRIYIKEDYEDAKKIQTWWDVQFVPDELFFSFSLLSHKKENIMKFAEVFFKLSSFKPSKDSFDKVTEEIKLLQTCQNKLSESFLAAAWYKKVMLEPLQFSPEEITAAASEVNYEDFNTFHNNLMKNLHFEWLIQGHLTQSEAETLVNKAESKIGFVQTIQDSEIARMRRMHVTLAKRTIYKHKKQNKMPKNPNSSILIAFVLDHKKDEIEFAKQQAKIQILSELIQDDFCDTIERQDSGLGDRCVSSVDCKSRLKHNYFEFRIMSSEQNPHFMENKINEYIVKLKRSKFQKFSEAIKLVKWQLAKSIKDKNPPVQVDSRKNWRQIIDSDTPPDFTKLRELEVKAIEETTLQDIEEFLTQMVFQDSTRVHIYVYSHPHLAQKEDLEKYKKINQDFYNNKDLYPEELSFELVDNIQEFQQKTLVPLEELH